MPQEFSAIDNLTVYENILLAATAKGAGTSFRDLLDRLGLWDVKERPFSKLSGGMKRKVGLAMALVGDSEVIFLDESTTGLDPTAWRETWRYLSSVRKEVRTVILTTHYMELCGYAAFKTHVSFGCDVIPQRVRARLEGKGYRVGRKNMRIRLNQRVPAQEIREILLSLKRSRA